MDAIEVVPIAAEHIAGYHACVDSVARERKFLAFLEALPLERSQSFVLGNIARGNPHFVALSGSAVVGWCDIVPLDRPVYAHAGVLGMGLLATHRGKGVGKLLMRAALDAAQAAGMTRVELTVRAANAHAIALYRRFGFLDEGTKRKAILVDGIYEDVICMAVLFP